MPFPHQYIMLTPEEQKKITRELKRLALLMQWKKRGRLQALYFSNQKQIFKNIANSSRVHYSTVRRWIYYYRKHGIDAFISLSNKKL